MNFLILNIVIEVPRGQQTMTPSSLNTDTSHAQGAGGVADLVKVDKKKKKKRNLLSCPRLSNIDIHADIHLQKEEHESSKLHSK